MASEMTLLIDGTPEDVRGFAVPDMDLSSARAGMLKRDYVLRINADYLIQLMSSAYEEWVAESKRDDEICGGPQDELAEAGYPRLEEVIKIPELLELTFGKYLNQALLRKLMWDGVSDVRYWQDWNSSCRLEEESIEFRGICYSHR